MISTQNTETDILHAARKIFHQAGFDGARMQEIANEAGINKALLHYYFRSKDKLFEAVFQDTLKTHLVPVVQVLISDQTLEEKIPIFVSRYIDQLLEYPYVPAFILHELNRNPNRLIQFVASQDVIHMQILHNQITDGINQGRYHKVNPMQLIAHLISMLVFPFVART